MDSACISAISASFRMRKSRSISAENFTGAKGEAAWRPRARAPIQRANWGRAGRSRRASTSQAGETVTLAEIDGPGAIQHIWLTVHPTALAATGAPHATGTAKRRPRSKTPLGDFFCNGWCVRCNVSSLPVAVNPAGGFNCYWEMPFRKRARITLENLAPDEVNGFYYQIDYTLTDVPDDRAYFHAQWRRSNPLPYRTGHTLLDGVKGQGQYVGTYIAWGVNNNGWWGEGEIKFYHGRRRRLPDHLRHRHRRLFRRRLELRASEGRIRRVHDALSRVCRRSSSRTASIEPAALRDVSLARHGPDPLPADLRVTIQALGWRSQLRGSATCRCRMTSPRPRSGISRSRTRHFRSWRSQRSRGYLNLRHSMSESTRRKVLITGAGGKIGSDLAIALADTYDLRLHYRRPPETLVGDDTVVADITDLDQVRAIMPGVDTVLHLAGEPSVPASWESVYTKNIAGTYHVLQAAHEAGVRASLHRRTTLWGCTM